MHAEMHGRLQEKGRPFDFPVFRKLVYVKD